MRVDYNWEDSAGESYAILAEVHPINRDRVTIISVTSAEDVDIDFDDFDDAEKMDIRWGAKRAAQELDSSEDPLDDNDEGDEDNDESNFSNY